MDLDEEELKATREIIDSKNIRDTIYKIEEEWQAKIVEAQEEFVKEQCYNYLANNKIVRTFSIDRETLEYIFNLGFTEYKRRNEEKLLGGENNERKISR